MTFSRCSMDPLVSNFAHCAHGVARDWLWALCGCALPTRPLAFVRVGGKKRPLLQRGLTLVVSWKIKDCYRMMERNSPTLHLWFSSIMDGFGVNASLNRNKTAQEACQHVGAGVK